MMRAIVWAIVSGLLVPGAGWAQSAPEPETSEAEVAVPPEKPPAGEAPPSSTETYTVQRGDTLWDISQRFLGNPWYWPKVWSYNPEIENPHWIYPGNQVRFFPGTEELPAQVEAGAAGADEGLVAPPAEMSDLTSGNIRSPDLMGQDDDVVTIAGPLKLGYASPRRSVLRQDGLVTKRELEEAGFIERSWAEKEMLSTFDKVYIRFRNVSGVRPGERYSVYRTVEEVVHPVTGEGYGYLTRVMGSLRIVALEQQVATGIIEHTIDPIARGDFLGPWGNFDKQVITKHASQAIQGVILASLVPKMPFMGENHVVFIDKGKKDGVEEGNLFRVMRRGDPLSRDPGEASRYPKEDVAALVVFDVKDAASAALVVRSLRELVVGDRVETGP